MLTKCDPRTYAIIGASTAFHREPGCYCLACVYREASTTEIGARNIPCPHVVELPISYKGRRLEASCRVDLI